MIQIESNGVFFTFKTADPENPIKPTIEGQEFAVDYFLDRLPQVNGMFGSAIDLDAVSANDLFQGLTMIGVSPRYSVGSGSIPQTAGRGVVY